MGRWGSWAASHVTRRSSRQRLRNKKHPKNSGRADSWVDEARIIDDDRGADGGSEAVAGDDDIR